MNFYTHIARKGNNLLVRGIENGKRIQKKVEYSPSLFIRSMNENEISSHNLEGEGLSSISFSNASEMYDWKKQYKDMDDFKIYGDVDTIWQYVAERYPEDIEFDPSLIKKANFDIEVHSPDEFPDADEAKHPVSAITIIRDGIFNVFALDSEQFGGQGGEWINKENRKDIKYQHFMHEHQLLEAFISFWASDYCDVITGWHIDGFDINYIVNRTRKLLGKVWVNKLSPWGIVKSRKFHDNWGGEKITWTLEGISVLDYMHLYQSYTYSKQESYKLDYIAYAELGEKKLSYDDMKGLHELYVKDFQKYIDYNIQDVNLVERLDEKMKLFDLVFTIAFLAKINFEDTSSPVRTWDALIYHFLGQDNIQVPPKSFNSKTEKIPGGYVKKPIIGRHGWTVSFDLASLYPSLARQYNLGTETHVPRWELPEAVKEIIPQVTEARLLNEEVDLSVLKEYDLSMSANVEFWRKDKKSFFSELFESLYTKRKVWKKEMLSWKSKKEAGEACDNEISKFNNMQMAAKILMNAGYGAMTNQYFRYYKDEMAQAITLSGQLTIKWAEQSFNNYLQALFKDDKDRIVAGDTDSNYILMQDLVDQVFPDGADIDKIINFLDKVCEEKLYPMITKRYTDLYEYMNAYQNLMIMEREAIAESAVWVGKKHYFMKVWNNEGVAYKGGKMKITGMEAVKSSTPEIGRNKLKIAYQHILDNEQAGLIKMVADFEADWKNKSILEISTPSGLKTLDKYRDSQTIYCKGVTKQARSALLFNDMLEKKGLPYPRVKQGNDIKMVPLKMPNPTRENVMGYIDFLPEEFGLNEYVDYDAAFHKNFISYLELVTNKIGWHWEERSTLEEFFV